MTLPAKYTLLRVRTDGTLRFADFVQAIVQLMSAFRECSIVKVEEMSWNISAEYFKARDVTDSGSIKLNTAEVSDWSL